MQAPRADRGGARALRHRPGQDSSLRCGPLSNDHTSFSSPLPAHSVRIKDVQWIYWLKNHRGPTNTSAEGPLLLHGRPTLESTSCPSETSLSLSPILSNRLSFTFFSFFALSFHSAEMNSNHFPPFNPPSIYTCLHISAHQPHQSATASGSTLDPLQPAILFLYKTSL